MMHERISREEALSQGRKTYFDGTTCKRGHVSPRYVSNAGCAQCAGKFRNKVNAHHPFDHEAGSYQPRILWASKTIAARDPIGLDRHLQAAAYEYCNAELAKLGLPPLITGLPQQPKAAPPPLPPAPVVQIDESRRIRAIYSMPYEREGTVKLADETEHFLWWPQIKGQRTRIIVGDMDAFTPKGLEELPWLWLDNQWYAYVEDSNTLHPVLNQAAIPSMIKEYGPLGDQ